MAYPQFTPRVHGVGCAVRTALLQCTQKSPIAIDERLVTLRFQLAKNRFATFVSVYSPTLDSSDDVKDRFYDTLHSTLRTILQNDKIILLGDFNARVGRNHDIWHGVIMVLATRIVAVSGCSLSALNWVLPSQTLSSNSVMRTRLLGCIPGPNTGTSLTTSLSGAVT